MVVLATSKQEGEPFGSGGQFALFSYLLVGYRVMRLSSTQPTT